MSLCVGQTLVTIGSVPSVVHRCCVNDCVYQGALYTCHIVLYYSTLQAPYSIIRLSRTLFRGEK